MDDIFTDVKGGGWLLSDSFRKYHNRDYCYIDIVSIVDDSFEYHQTLESMAEVQELVGEPWIFLQGDV